MGSILYVFQTPTLYFRLGAPKEPGRKKVRGAKKWKSGHNAWELYNSTTGH